MGASWSQSEAWQAVVTKDQVRDAIRGFDEWQKAQDELKASLTVQRSAPSTGTLLERVGGSDSVRRIVEAYVRKLYADDQLAVFLQTTDMTSLRAKQSNFLCWLFSPKDQPNTSRHVRTAHLRIIKQRGFTQQHFETGLTHLEAALREHGLNEALVKEVMAKVRPYSDLAFTPLARDVEDEKRWALEEHLKRPPSAAAASTAVRSRPPSATSPPGAGTGTGTGQSSAVPLTTTSSQLQLTEQPLQQQQQPLQQQQQPLQLSPRDRDPRKPPRSPPLPSASPSPSTPPLPAQQGPQHLPPPPQQHYGRHLQPLLLPHAVEAAGASATAAAVGSEVAWHPSGPPSPSTTNVTATTAAATAAASPSSTASFPVASVASVTSDSAAPAAPAGRVATGDATASGMRLVSSGPELAPSPSPRAHSATWEGSRATAFRPGPPGVGSVPQSAGPAPRCPFTGARLSRPAISASELPDSVNDAVRAPLGVQPPPLSQSSRPPLRLVSSGPTTPPGGRVGAIAGGGGGSGPASVSACVSPPVGPPPLAPLSLASLPPLALPPPPPLPSARSSVAPPGQATPPRRSAGRPVGS